AIAFQETLYSSSWNGVVVGKFWDTNFGQGVTTNDYDGDGDRLTVQLVSGPAHGTFSLTPTDTFTYTPDNDFVGTDGFIYRLSDGVSTSAAATVLISVGDNIPYGQSDSYRVSHDNILSVPKSAEGVLKNDGDADGDRLTALLVSGPAHGTLQL